MASFLLELYSEEIPARMQAQAARTLANALQTLFKDAGLSHGGVQYYHAPQRVAVMVEDVPASQPASQTELRGPREGAPEAALEGFCRNLGIAPQELVLEDTPKGRFYFHRTQQKARSTQSLLEAQLPALLGQLSWPKSMRWGAHEMRWVRPLHRMVAMLDEQVLEVALGHVQASNITHGHRFMAPEPIALSHAQDYLPALLNAKVMVDQAARKAVITQGAQAFAAQHHLSLIEDAALLDEVVGLVEWPVMLLGQFDAAFLALPEEVLISTIRTHQKYFCLRDQAGKLAPYFIITANTEAADGGQAIAAGNARVIRARLSDAVFFEAQDKKHSLDYYADKLGGIVFHNQLGTIAEKMRRVKGLAQFLAVWVPGADLLEVGRAADIAKADLATELVGECPELQGMIGRYYALYQHEPEAVADAILQHYAPKGEADIVPTAPVSVTLALADKIDTLVGLFAIDEVPTGSKDPFALRRAALGVLRIIRENQLSLPLWVALKHAFKEYPMAIQKKGKKTTDQLQQFFADRLSHMLKREGVRGDVIHAVLAAQDPQDNILHIAQKIQAVAAALQQEEGQDLAAAFKRAHNILKALNKPPKGAVQTKWLEAPAELALYQALEAAQKTSAEHMKQEQYAAALDALATLREPIDTFFKTVKVNIDNDVLRQNRLKLLHEYTNTVKTIADFALVE